MKLGFERIKSLAELTQRLTVILGQLIGRVTTLESSAGSNGSTEIPDGSITSAKLADDIDFVNTPSISGTSMFDSGSNANGTWIKFPDGTMICTHTLTYSAITQATGNIFRSISVTTWTFPQTFIASPQVNGNDASSSNIWMGTSSTTTSAGIRGMFPTSLAGSRTARVVAIGRWV